ncbi:hypothetical protein GQ43DRAFT_165279 [Delitschia confertaspora ATCC 74209]|uniref:RING-CH-type domain-containing protein n=1 Tax=Delitschia confertaspora ATCC 74209 TaxID=1513339 RepID=A0A9P4JHG2_9PLEO|nr:hypothetical protein GQ43DRAFT_165279 [Delitschia confertaspora ATCC 74209]
MASLPPRPASQRRSTPLEQDSASSSKDHEQANIEAHSIASEDSQTLLLNNRPSESPKLEEQKQAIPSSSQPTEPDNEPRKCWICFSDETEDEPTTSEWRSPCPCVLVAHEKCLLDWIADMEAPNGRRRAGGSAKVTCPQCKSEIRVARPRSVVVDVVRVLERLTGVMLVPGIFFVIGTATYSTLTFLGRQAVYEVFGLEDGLRILRPLYYAPDASENAYVLRLFNHLRHHWRLDLGLPLIPTALIASRTSLADGFLPFLPFIFFTSSASQEQMLNLQWPPSAAFAITALPYIRGIYNTYYERVWAPRERKWLKEIQPRAGDAENENAEVNENLEHIHEVFEDDGVMEVEVDFDIFADWNNGGEADNHDAEEAPPVPIARGPARPAGVPQDAQEAAPAPDAPQRRNRIRERNINFSTSSVADTILGALIFPSIAAAVGEALKYALPKSWIAPPAFGKPTGLLQQKWGRSIVGGCLFVGIKDAVMLYVRWKMAHNHRKRKVLDYDKGKKRPVRR